jgi:hypothetical protein
MNASRIFPSRRVYWSQLRERSPLTIVLLDQPRDSKFPDRLPYVRFRVDGEDPEHELQIESEAARWTLEKNVAVGVPTTVAATGTGEHAELKVQGAAPARRSPAAAPAAPGASSDAPEGDSLARSYFAALEAATELVATFKERHGREPSEAERTIACSLWIEQNRSGGRRPLRSRGGGR